jgi:hypothetical protein
MHDVWVYTSCFVQVEERKICIVSDTGLSLYVRDRILSFLLSTYHCSSSIVEDILLMWGQTQLIRSPSRQDGGCMRYIKVSTPYLNLG